MKSNAKGLLLCVVLACLLVALLFWSFSIGDRGDVALSDVIFQLRFERSLAAILVGAALAVGGVLVQGLFNNELASPSILGTTAGASLGSQIVLLGAAFLSIRSDFVPRLIPLGALLGAFFALAILLLLLRRDSRKISVVLVGFVLSALFISFGSLITAMAQHQWDVGRAVIFFSLGGVSGVTPTQLLFSGSLIIVGIVYAWLWGRPLDLLLSGHDEARALGVDVDQVHRWVALWVSILVAGAVAIAGNIGFVGLVVPNGMRLVIGDRHRLLVVSSALAGALFVLGADVLVRALPSESEIPLGVITGLIGAPFFIWHFSRRGAHRV